MKRPDLEHVIRAAAAITNEYGSLQAEKRTARSYRLCSNSGSSMRTH